MTDPTRRDFHRTLAVGTVAVATGTTMAADKPADPPIRDYPAPKFQPQFKTPPLDKILVQDFVLYAHSDLEMVKLLLNKQPKLATAAMDWGGGDWETGLGGASHLGRRDIAEYLLANGARIDIFAATMLGQLDVVKGLLTAFPKLIDTPGPHGISLHVHAKMGGKDAAPVLEYLQTLKMVDLTPKAPPKKPE